MEPLRTSFGDSMNEGKHPDDDENEEDRSNSANDDDDDTDGEFEDAMNEKDGDNDIQNKTKVFPVYLDMSNVHRVQNQRGDADTEALSYLRKDHGKSQGRGRSRGRSRGRRQSRDPGRNHGYDFRSKFSSNSDQNRNNENLPYRRHSPNADVKNEHGHSLNPSSERRKRTLAPNECDPDSFIDLEANTAKTSFPHALKTTKVKVTGFDSEMDSEYLQMYFENERKSGGGDIDDIVFNSDSSVIITFSKTQVAQRVLKRSHTISGYNLTVVEKQEELGCSDTPDSKEEETSGKVIEVSGFKPTTSDEMLEMYFESRRSGGGEISNIEMNAKNNKAIISFVDHLVIDRVMKKSHTLEGELLTVVEKRAQPSRPIDRHKIFLRGIPERVTEETLLLYIENRTNLENPVIVYGEQPGTAMLNFRQEIQDLDSILVNFSKRKLNTSTITAEQVKATNCILVQGIQPNISGDIIELYFDNQRKSGGGDVVNVQMDIEENRALVYFADWTVVDKVTARSHVLSGHKIVVTTHNECLGTTVSTDGQMSVIPKPFPYPVKEEVMKYVMRKQAEALTKLMPDVEVIWPFDGDTTRCLLKPVPRDGVDRSIWRNWKRDTDSKFSRFLQQFVIELIQIPTNIWADIRDALPRMKETLLGDIDVYERGETNTVLFIGIPSLVGKAKDSLSKSINELKLKADRDAMTTIMVIKLNSLKFKLFTIFSLKLDLMKGHPQVQISAVSETNTLSFKGIRAEISECQVDMYGIFEEISVRSIVPDSNRFQFIEQFCDIVNDALTKENIAAVCDVADSKIFVHGKIVSDSERAEKFLKANIISKKLEIKSESTMEAFLSPNGKEKLDALNKSGQVIIELDQVNYRIQITGFTDRVNDASAEIGQFIDENVKDSISTSVDDIRLKAKREAMKTTKNVKLSSLKLKLFTAFSLQLDLLKAHPEVQISAIGETNTLSFKGIRAEISECQVDMYGIFEEISVRSFKTDSDKFQFIERFSDVVNDALTNENVAAVCDVADSKILVHGKTVTDSDRAEKFLEANIISKKLEIKSETTMEAFLSSNGKEKLDALNKSGPVIIELDQINYRIQITGFTDRVNDVSAEIGQFIDENVKDSISTSVDEIQLKAETEVMKTTKNVKLSSLKLKLFTAFSLQLDLLKAHPEVQISVIDETNTLSFKGIRAEISECQVAMYGIFEEISVRSFKTDSDKFQFIERFSDVVNDALTNESVAAVCDVADSTISVHGKTVSDSERAQKFLRANIVNKKLEIKSESSMEVLLSSNSKEKLDTINESRNVITGVDEINNKVEVTGFVDKVNDAIDEILDVFTEQRVPYSPFPIKNPNEKCGRELTGIRTRQQEVNMFEHRSSDSGFVINGNGKRITDDRYGHSQFTQHFMQSKNTLKDADIYKPSERNETCISPSTSTKPVNVNTVVKHEELSKPYTDSNASQPTIRTLQHPYQSSEDFASASNVNKVAALAKPFERHDPRSFPSMSLNTTSLSDKQDIFLPKTGAGHIQQISLDADFTKSLPLMTKSSQLPRCLICKSSLDFKNLECYEHTYCSTCITMFIAPSASCNKCKKLYYVTEKYQADLFKDQNRKQQEETTAFDGESISLLDNVAKREEHSEEFAQVDKIKFEYIMKTEADTLHNIETMYGVRINTKMHRDPSTLVVTMEYKKSNIKKVMSETVEDELTKAKGEILSLYSRTIQDVTVTFLACSGIKSTKITKAVKITDRKFADTLVVQEGSDVIFCGNESTIKNVISEFQLSVGMSEHADGTDLEITVNCIVFQFLYEHSSEFKRIQTKYQVTFEPKKKTSSPTECGVFLKPVKVGKQKKKISDKEVKDAKESFISLYQNIFLSLRRTTVQLQGLSPDDIRKALATTQKKFSKVTVTKPTDDGHYVLCAEEADADRAIQCFRTACGMQPPARKQKKSGQEAASSVATSRKVVQEGSDVIFCGNESTIKNVISEFQLSVGMSEHADGTDLEISVNCIVFQFLYEHSSEFKRIQTKYQVTFKPKKDTSSPTECGVFLKPVKVGKQKKKISDKEVKDAKESFISLYQNIFPSLRRTTVQLQGLYPDDIRKALATTQKKFSKVTVTKPTDDGHYVLCTEEADADRAIQCFRTACGMQPPARKQKKSGQEAASFVATSHASGNASQQRSEAKTKPEHYRSVFKQFKPISAADTSSTIKTTGLDYAARGQTTNSLERDTELKELTSHSNIVPTNIVPQAMSIHAGQTASGSVQYSNQLTPHSRHLAGNGIKHTDISQPFDTRSFPPTSSNTTSFVATSHASGSASQQRSEAKTKPGHYPSVFSTNEGLQIIALTEDLTKQQVDAIVNAAKSNLRHDGGVAKAISNAAGPNLQRDCDSIIWGRKLQTSECVETKGYNLHCQTVIHTVRPIFSIYDKNFEHNLKKTFLNVLNHANGKGNLKTIAIPLISSGYYGGPLERCTEALTSAIYDFSKERKCSNLLQVYLVNIQDATTQAIQQSLHKRFHITADKLKKAFSAQFSDVFRQTSETDTSNISKSHPQFRAPNMASPLVFEAENEFKVIVQLSGITKVKADVLLKSADEKLRHDDVMSNLINEEAGPELQNECKEIIKARKRLRPGEFATTGGYKLPYEKVVHFVKPQSSNSWEETLLKIMLHIKTTLKASTLAVSTSSLSLSARPPSGETLHIDVLAKVIKRFSRFPSEKLVKGIAIVCDDDKDFLAIEKDFARQFKPISAADASTTIKTTILDQAARGQITNPLERDPQRQELTSHSNIVPQAMSTRANQTASRSVQYPNRPNPHSMHSAGTEIKHANISQPPTARSTARSFPPISSNTTNVSDMQSSFPSKQDSGLSHHTSLSGNVPQSSTMAPNSNRQLQCLICKGYSDVKKLECCEHTFCFTCIELYIAPKDSCRECRQLYSVTEEKTLKGMMTYYFDKDVALPDSQANGAIVMIFDIPGNQGAKHPKPGWQYLGTRVKAYLPFGFDGCEVVKQLRTAFIAGKLFAIKQLTSKTYGVCLTNLIPLKQGKTKGDYPDQRYMAVVKKALSQHVSGST